MSVSVESAVLFPVFVLAKDSGEVIRFDSAVEMNYLEAVDVANDEYDAWDANGRVLHLAGSQVSRRSSGNIAVSATELTADLAEFKKLTQVANKVR